MLIELDPVDRITADAVGEAGSRTFYLQARKDAQLVTLVVEKQQVQLLAASVVEILSRVGKETGQGPPEELMGLDQPLEPEWRAGRLSIGYQEERDLLMLEAEELLPEDEEEAGAEEEAGGLGGLAEFGVELGAAEVEESEELEGPEELEDLETDGADERGVGRVRFWPPASRCSRWPVTERWCVRQGVLAVPSAGTPSTPKAIAVRPSTAITAAASSEPRGADLGRRPSRPDSRRDPAAGPDAQCLQLHLPDRGGRPRAHGARRVQAAGRGDAAVGLPRRNAVPARSGGLCPVPVARVAGHPAHGPAGGPPRAGLGAAVHRRRPARALLHLAREVFRRLHRRGRLRRDRQQRRPQGRPLHARAGRHHLGRGPRRLLQP